MLNGKTVAVVIPAYNEERQISFVLDSMPEFVDRIVVVNDCSTDNTATVVKARIQQAGPAALTMPKHHECPSRTPHNRAEILLNKVEHKSIKYYTPSKVANENPETDRIILINQSRNAGNGKAIGRGYKWCIDHAIDCTVTMDADGQMDPMELPIICGPIVRDEVDYTKGNRLIHRSAWLVMPKIRYFGNSILSIFTKVASGYWHVSDTQCGYTAISLQALKAIRPYEIYKRYGWPNDMLVKLNIAFCSIREVGIKPVYKVGEKSKMSILKVVPTISWLLFRSFFERLWIKYLFRDFHPLFLLYNQSFLTALVLLPFTVKILSSIITGEYMSYSMLLLFVFLGISGFQALLFAMWMDMQDNERLQK